MNNKPYIVEVNNFNDFCNIKNIYTFQQML